MKPWRYDCSNFQTHPSHAGCDRRYCSNVADGLRPIREQCTNYDWTVLGNNMAAGNGFLSVSSWGGI